MQEKGFTKVDNEVLESICNRENKLNATQMTIILLVIRYTSGFSREAHALSTGFLSNASGIHKQQIKEELNNLIDRKIITVTKEASFSSSRELKLNMDTSEWNIKKGYQETSLLPGTEFSTTTGSKSSTTPGSEFTPQERKYIKKNIKKCSCESFDLFWNAYPKGKRKAKQAALKAWNKLNPDDMLLKNILSALEAQTKSEQWTKDNGKFIPYPATWLNDMRWEDEPEQAEDESFYENNKATERILTLDDFESG